MTNEWEKAKKQIATLRNYFKTLPPALQEKKAYCYLITKEEIEKLLAQAGNKSLDGIRVYLGAHIEGNYIVPTAHVVACEKDKDGAYNDYNIGDTAPGSADKAATPLLADVRPCPKWCGKTNFLNS